MKKIIVISIVLMLVLIAGIYILVSSGEEWGYDTSEINSMRFKLQINYKDGSTSTLSQQPLVLMFNDKIVESITYYAEIKGTSEVYNSFEITNYGPHYILTDDTATDTTNQYKDKTFYNTGVNTIQADGEWYSFIEKTLTPSDMEITPDVTPTSILPYGDYKIWLFGHFQYRYGDIGWKNFDMDKTTLVIHYAEDILNIETSGGTNLDNDDGDIPDETPPEWEEPVEEEEPPEEEPPTSDYTGMCTVTFKVYDSQATMNPQDVGVKIYITGTGMSASTRTGSDGKATIGYGQITANRPEGYRFRIEYAGEYYYEDVYLTQPAETYTYYLDEIF